MITVKNLYFSYNGKSPYIIEDLNFEVQDGDYISVIGENGSGKTTLMRILLGFLYPTQGQVIIETGSIGYVPQKNNAANAGFPITVWETLDSYRRLLKIKDTGIIMESLKLVGMEPFKNSLIGNLSGGQTQKIQIARAIMGKPKLLILDEPSTGVDIKSQNDIYRILKEMNMNHHITVVSVEHNLQAVFTYSQAIYHMQNGKGHLCSPDKYAKEYLHLEERNPNHVTI